MRALATLADTLQKERGHLFPWVPVFLGIGIGLYFVLPVEPRWPVYAALGLTAFLCIAALRFLDEGLRPLFVAVALIMAGVILAGLRAQSVAAPQLGFRYYGPIEGRIINIDRSQSDKPRLTLDRVVLENTSPERTPARVRVALHGKQGYLAPLPGMRVMMTGHLSPPQGPVEPGGFDFQRKAWFEGLGAVGYTRTPALALEPPSASHAGIWIHRIRMALSNWMQMRIPGEAGAFAAAIVTGDRSGIGVETLKDLRASNLAHLLAISGLHMGLLTGFVFAALRYGLALVPYVALRLPVKKIAAALAMIVAAIYLALSGGNVATQRAFVMVAVMLTAVLLDRKAMTLRAVAMAAIILLLLRPEALTGPGFQMSFAATTALVAVFGAIRDHTALNTRMPGWLRPVVALVVSSAVAGAATAPIAAVHFNQIAQYGLLANLLTVPVMGSIVIPAAVLTALLYPLGLAQLGLWVMRVSINWILGVTHWVAGIDGATSHVPTPAPVVLALIALGGLTIIIWQGRLRLLGIPLAAAGFAIWSQTDRPALLISGGGEIFGLMTPEGRALSKAKGQGFVAKSWLENDGDTAPQLAAFQRGGIGGEKGALRFSLGRQDFLHLSGKAAAGRIGAECTGDVWIILPAKADAAGNCVIWDAARLAASGALAIYEKDGALSVRTARQSAGRRLWNRPVARRTPRRQ